MRTVVYEKALKVFENMVKEAFEDSEVKIVLFGSRAKRRLR
jgi:predicted nucleotidyltransferase